MTPMENLRSIASYGILSHVQADTLPHASVALEEVQDRRAARRLPSGRLLHEYANLYFHARNAMMYRRRSADLVVARVSETVLDLPGVFITDGNAANGPTSFFRSPGGLLHLDAERVYAERWDVADEQEMRERRRQRQAEVLVPDVVPRTAIIGWYVPDAGAAVRCRRVLGDVDVVVDSDVFFR